MSPSRPSERHHLIRWSDLRRRITLHGGWSRRAAVVCGVVSAGCLLGAQGASALPIVAPLAGSPFSGSGNPYTVAFSPSGKFVATANQSGTVSMFSVSVGGALTPVAGSPVTMAGTSPSAQSLAFSPDGTLLAVADPSVNAVDVLSVSASGTLTQVPNSPFHSPAGSEPQAVAFSPGGQLLAIANVGLGTVSVDSVSAGGALTSVGSPSSTGVGSQPWSLSFNSAGGLLAVGNLHADTVSMFSVSAGGALAPVSGSPYPTGSPTPLSVKFSPSGGLLATANSVSGSAGTMSLFSVAAGGALTAVSGSPFATGAGARAVAFSSDGLVAVANYSSSTMSVFSVTSGGALTAVSGSPFSTEGSLPSSVAFSPNGGMIAAANLLSSSVTIFSADAPVSQIGSPANGGVYAINQPVTTSFSCTDASDGPGISSCIDPTGASGSTDTGSGSAGSGVLDTSTVGQHTYTVTATSANSRTSIATRAYRVVGPAAGGPWSPGATVPDARYLAVAAPLTNGDVLLTGGSDSGGNTGDSELYDPARDTWTDAATLPDPRYAASAATLGNGDVLVTGGQDNQGLTGNTEIYDPTENSWDQTDDLPDPRFGAASAPLANGNVLVSGGVAANGVTGDTEIYDPNGEDQDWSNAASLPDGRIGAVAAPLANGDVLVTGGSDSNGLTGDTEIYDPGANTWTHAANLPDPRDFAMAAPLTNGDVLVAGGGDANGVTGDTEIYDPDAGTWTPAPALPDARNQGVAAPLPNGNVLVTSGDDQNGLTSDTEISGPAEGAPTARISTPGNDAVYSPNESVTTHFGCAEGTGGPGISTCTDGHGGSGSSGSLDTSTAGTHTYRVTAWSSDGQFGAASISYTVAGPPSVTITAPADRQTFNLGQSVTVGFSCVDAPAAPGISSCNDSHGGAGTTGSLDTSTAGTHAYIVTATSEDGQTATATLHYTVTAPPPTIAGLPTTLVPPTIAGSPTIVINTPADGASYRYGQDVNASFSCQDAGDTPGLQLSAGCAGTFADGAPIDTSTPGTHTFTVTATSQDGQATTDTTSYAVSMPNNHLATSTPTTSPDGQVTLNFTIPGPGTVDILETAWTPTAKSSSDLMRTDGLLQAATGRFVFARGHRTISHAGAIQLRTQPNRRAERLIGRHHHVIKLRLWITYTPTGGRQRTTSIPGVRIP